ncbi:MAG TPA: Ig domain-containing protein [Planctomycetota bacterium]|nr:Ig domain-containing protein [Planctomycetota bacterium]
MHQGALALCASIFLLLAGCGRSSGEGIPNENSPIVLSPDPSQPLPDASVATPYSASITVVGGGLPPYVIAVTDLPPGLVYQGNGRIAGTPTTPGQSSIEVDITDSGQALTTFDYSLTVR